MPRPPQCRKVGPGPICSCFKPQGIPSCELDEVLLGLDEFEALRLADLEGQYQETAAEEMRVSRQTFARIVESARKKVADALVNGKVLRIEGGPISTCQHRKFKCSGCAHLWAASKGGGRPVECPKCGGAELHRLHEDEEPGHGGKRCHRRREQQETP